MKLLIIVPTLGRAPTLGNTIESIRQNCGGTYRISLVCPRQEIQRLSVLYPDLTIVADSGGGLYPALNEAINQAEADWSHFTYINDDDLLLSGFGDLVGRDVDLAYGKCMIHSRRSNALWFPLERNPKAVPVLFVYGVTGIQQPGTIFSKHVWIRCGPFDVRFRLNADMYFILLACSSARSHYVSYGKVAAFTFTPGQLSSNRVRVDDENRLIRERLSLQKNLSSRYCLLRFRLSNFCLYFKRALSGVVLQRSFYDE